MATPPILLILGAGPRLGSGIACKFASQGFHVAIASRSLTDNTLSPEGYFQISVDLSQPLAVPGVFEALKSHFGCPPSVVVYNGKPAFNSKTSLIATDSPCIGTGAYRQLNPADDPFFTPLEEAKRSLTVGFESHYVAAQQAIKGFAALPEEIPKTFIFTGNALNQIPLPEVFSFAVGKRAAAALIEYGANAYGGKGWRFYYADQRDPRDGRPVGQDIDGDAHGEMYWQLAQPGKQHKWLVTFTKDNGRVEYGGVDWEGRPYRPEY